MSAYHVEPGSNPYELEIKLIDSLAARRRAGARLSARQSHRALGRAAEHGLPCAQSRRRGHRRPGARRAPHPGNGFPGLCRRHRSARQQGPRHVSWPSTCRSNAAACRSHPGDWIFGDVDGVVVIPGDSAEKVLTLSLDKVTQETTVRDELAAGESLATVFARHQIL